MSGTRECQLFHHHKGTPKRMMKETLFTRHRSAVEPLMIAKDRKTTLQAIHTMAANQAVTSLGRNDSPPAINISEKELTRKERTTLAQLRSGHCRLLGSYKSRISKDVSLDVCADCGNTPHDVKHLGHFIIRGTFWPVENYFFPLIFQCHFNTYNVNLTSSCLSELNLS